MTKEKYDEIRAEYADDSKRFRFADEDHSGLKDGAPELHLTVNEEIPPAPFPGALKQGDSLKILGFSNEAANGDFMVRSLTLGEIGLRSKYVD